MSDKKTLSQADTAKLAAEIAAKKAAEIGAEVGAAAGLKRYEAEQKRQKKKRIDRRLRDTKRLLTHYQEIKIHAEDAIASLAEINDEDYDFFQRLMEDDTSVDVDAIITSKVKSSIMLDHIDTMLHKYEQITFASKRDEEMRRYRVLESMCISDEPMSVAAIAERENVHERTVYKDLDAACSKMGALLFGVQWIERDAD